MLIDSNQVSTIKKIIEVFETGKLSKNYGIVTILPDGAGISYGSNQYTDKSNSLDDVVMRYLDKCGTYSQQLSGYLHYLQKDATTVLSGSNLPQWTVELMNLLKEAGDKDPKMGLAQEEIFDENYWQPAMSHVNAMRLTLPLSIAVVYDTCIHSGPGGVNTIRKLFPEYPPSRNGDEKKWTEAYVKARKSWLLNFKNETVRKTIYRQDCFLELIKQGNWHLNKEFKVLGVKIV